MKYLVPARAHGRLPTESALCDLIVFIYVATQHINASIYTALNIFKNLESYHKYRHVFIVTINIVN